MSPGHSSDDPIDRFWETLSHPMRRATLQALKGTEKTTVETAASEIPSTDAYRTDGGRLPEESDRVEVMLHHHHLPKMANAGAIDYDRESGTIQTNSTTERICDLMDTLES